MQHPDWENEQNRLNQVIQYLKVLIGKKFAEKDNLIEQQSDINHSMWEDAGSINDLEAISDFMQHINFLKQNMAWAKKTSLEIVRLDKQLINPYFARIDFRTGNDLPEQIYIGINTLVHDETGEILIYDWRAPISSMFYDFEPGPSSYFCPAGTIKGEMTLKRQFRIITGKIELMFDSSLAIQDNILQELLAGNTSGRMKTIVSTIQKEQNTAIRHEKTRVLAVQGMAGSGKTSVAMHRASYLLYKHKKTITSDNLIILSSTDVLSEYISDVLPELGEEEIKGSTYPKLFMRYFQTGLVPETHPEMLESLLTSDSSVRNSRLSAIRLKSSATFLEAMQRLFDYALSHIIRFETLSYNNQIIARKEELEELFYKDFEKMPVAQRFKRIEYRISEKLKALKRQRTAEKAEEIESEDAHLSHREAKALSKLSINEDARSLNEKIGAMLSISTVSLYRELFSSDETFDYCLRDLLAEDDMDFVTNFRKDSLESLSRNRLPYEDLAPFLLLSLLFGISEPDQSVKHVIIDEAQDYSRVQLFTLARLFPAAGITLLGDVNQNISLNTSALTLKEAAELISPDDHAFLTLDKSYRSTVEITRFASQFLSSPSGEPFGRHGEIPSFIPSPDYDALLKVLAVNIRREIDEGRKTTAIITKNLRDANKLYDSLKKAMASLPRPFRLMDQSYEYALEGVMVIPSYLSKGLEFDTVHIVFENRDDYSSGCEKGLLYTLLSRALHKLSLYSAEPGLPAALTGIDQTLYNMVNK